MEIGSCLMQFKELEFKYDAKDVSMDEFSLLIEKLNPNRWMIVSSYDEFFINKDGDFIRYRFTDDRGELTIKRKTISANNFNRVEVNLPTSGKNFAAVNEFCSLLGYRHNFGIYKTCKIAFFEKAVFVYYVVYDKELKELRRFIEVEANEDYSWNSEKEALDFIEGCEESLKNLGITSKNRLRKSLFEMFKKDA
jgi:adenylate cyclase class IV